MVVEQILTSFKTSPTSARSPYSFLVAHSPGFIILSQPKPVPPAPPAPRNPISSTFLPQQNPLHLLLQHRSLSTLLHHFTSVAMIAQTYFYGINCDITDYELISTFTANITHYRTTSTTSSQYSHQDYFSEYTSSLSTFDTSTISDIHDILLSNPKFAFSHYASQVSNTQVRRKSMSY